MNIQFQLANDINTICCNRNLNVANPEHQKQISEILSVKWDLTNPDAPKLRDPIEKVAIQQFLEALPVCKDRDILKSFIRAMVFGYSRVSANVPNFALPPEGAFSIEINPEFWNSSVVREIFETPEAYDDFIDKLDVVFDQQDAVHKGSQFNQSFMNEPQVRPYGGFGAPGWPRRPVFKKLPITNLTPPWAGRQHPGYPGNMSVFSNPGYAQNMGGYGQRPFGEQSQAEGDEFTIQMQNTGSLIRSNVHAMREGLRQAGLLNPSVDQNLGGTPQGFNRMPIQAGPGGNPFVPSNADTNEPKTD